VAEVTWHGTAKCCWCKQPLTRTDDGPWWCVTPACNQKQQDWSAFRREYDTRTKKTLRKHWMYVPTPRQVEWHQAVLRREITRLLVGGQAGPGKSRWLREALYKLAQAVPGFHGLLLRRTH
jgi:hypothetical protein